MNNLKEQREQGIIEKSDEQIFQEVLGKDTHGYLRAYGPGRSITKHFHVKPSRLDLSQEINEIKSTAEKAIQEANKKAEEAMKEVENAKKEAEILRNEVNQKLSSNNKALQLILQACGINSETNWAESDNSSN